MEIPADIRNLADDRLHLTGPVQLVAEEIRDHQHRRLEILELAPERQLVDLDDRRIGLDDVAAVGSAGQQRRDADVEVVAAVVVDDLQAAGAQAFRDQIAGRGLAVGAGDQDDDGRHLKAADEIFVHRQSQRAGERASPAAAVQNAVYGLDQPETESAHAQSFAR